MSLKDKANQLDSELMESKKGLTVSDIQSETGKSHISASRVRASESLKADNITRQSKPKISQELLDATVNVLNRGLKAKTKFWDRETKQWIESDDIRSQIETVKLIYAYEFGMPIQMQIKIETSVKDNDEQLLRLVQSSPEARREMIKFGVVTEEWIASRAKKVN